MGYWQHRNVFPCCEYSVFSIFDVNDVLSKFDGFINLLDVGNEGLIGSKFCPTLIFLCGSEVSRGTSSQHP